MDKTNENHVEVDYNLTTKRDWFCDILISGILSKSQSRLFSYLFKKSCFLNHTIDKTLNQISKEMNLESRELRRVMNGLENLRLVASYKTSVRNKRNYLLIYQPLISLQMRIKLQSMFGASIIGIDRKWLLSKPMKEIGKSGGVIKSWTKFPSILSEIHYKNALQGVESTLIRGVDSTLIRRVESTLISRVETTHDRRVKHDEIIDVDAEPSYLSGSISSFYSRLDKLLLQKIRVPNVRVRVRAQIEHLIVEFGFGRVEKAYSSLENGSAECLAYPHLGTWLKNNILWSEGKLKASNEIERGAEMHSSVAVTISEVREGLKSNLKKNELKTPLMTLKTKTVLNSLGVDLDETYKNYKNNPSKGFLEGLTANIWKKAKDIYQF